jgi:hypothetical protein
MKIFQILTKHGHNSNKNYESTNRKLVTFSYHYKNPISYPIGSMYHTETQGLITLDHLAFDPTLITKHGSTYTTLF